VLHRGDLSLAGHDAAQDLWGTVLQTKPSTLGEQAVMNQMLSEISLMTEHRRVRQIESESKLPAILWVVLIAGGAITTVSSCLFGIENFRLHCVQVASLTLLLSLILVAIADIDRPFQGTIPHYSPRFRTRPRDVCEHSLTLAPGQLKNAAPVRLPLRPKCGCTTIPARR